MNTYPSSLFRLVVVVMVLGFFALMGWNAHGAEAQPPRSVGVGPMEWVRDVGGNLLQIGVLPPEEYEFLRLEKGEKDYLMEAAPEAQTSKAGPSAPRTLRCFGKGPHRVCTQAD